MRLIDARGGGYTRGRAMTASVPQRIQRFEVMEPLGRGGMGSVFRARDPQLDRDVAIKLLAEPAAAPRAPGPHETLDLRTEGPATADDLVREARMMAQLSHPNVLPVYEVGVAEGAVYVVMELVDGTDLRGWLATPRPTAEVLDAFAQAGRGLLAAHARSIVHRDFKPDNVLVGADGRVRVADFGLSRQARPAGSMIRIDDGRGTPRYMAPELWRGEPATARSDVFAFCAALAEALGDDLRALPARTRALVAAGQAGDPAARPALAQLVAALGAPSRRRWWLAGGGAVVAAAAAVALGAWSIAGSAADDGPGCTLDPALFTGRWDAAIRTALAERLGAAAAPVVALLDGQRRDIEAHGRAACEARAADQLTADQTRARTACLEHRAFELGAVVGETLRRGPDVELELDRIADRIHELPPAADCAELAVATAAPPPERGVARELYRRWAALDGVAAPVVVAETAAIERAAAAAGDPELEVRAALRHGAAQRDADQLELADTALQRAYRRALELHDDAHAALALVERSRVASLRGDAASARSLAELALDLADKPHTPPRVRARLLGALGHADRDRGDYQAAVGVLERGLAALGETGQRHPYIELGLRFDLAYALVNLEGRRAAGVALARDTVAVAGAIAGEHDVLRARALDLLAYALRTIGDVAGALPHRREAVAIAAAALPPASAQLVRFRANLADDLSASGDYEQARRELTDIVDAAGRVAALRRYRATWLGDLGITTFASGRFDAGLELLARAVEELTSQHGKHHPRTLEYRVWLLAFDLEVDRLDDAERQIAALDEGYRARPEQTAIRLAVLRGVYAATIARIRGAPRDAEALTRAALATATELGVGADDHIDLLLVLAAGLVDQRRWADARAPLEQALALGRSINDVEDRRAELEIKLALVERALGHAAIARDRAAGARDILASHPSRVMASRDVAAFFAAR
jgi:tetratricopeptide (TPR) repeat protein